LGYKATPASTNYEWITYAQAKQAIQEFGSFMVNKNLDREKFIGIYAKNRPEVTISSLFTSLFIVHMSITLFLFI
jgi:long-subunit acyl-CoA synthetase (AMP-forming)